MNTLPLASVQTVISEAWDHWLHSNENNFNVNVPGHVVGVVVNVTDRLFNCGMPGFNMDNDDVPALKAWAPTAIVTQQGHGAMLPCKMVGQIGQVNVQYLATITFNFHVNLTGPCEED